MATAKKKSSVTKPSAKVIPIKPVTSWSFSRYGDYLQCPLKFKLKHIDKIKEPGNEAMNRGAEIHTMAEHYIRGLSPTLPDELKKLGPELKKLRAQYKKDKASMVLEDNWAFTKDWDQTRWDDWTHCWVRIKLDCAHEVKGDTLVVTDWKTGKFRPDQQESYLEQLELYALAALILHPHLKEIRPRLGYVDHGIYWPPVDEPLVYTQADVPRLKKAWEKRVLPMMSDRIFAPRPNRFCNWCHFRKANTPNLPNQKQLCEY